MKVNQLLTICGVAAALMLSAGTVSAQNDNGGNGGGGGGGGGFRNRGNFDPAQFQQRMMERVKDELEVTDDNEWKALEPMVQKVMDARMQMMQVVGGGRAMFGGRNRGGDNAQNQNDQRRGPFSETSNEGQTLRKAIDGKAPKAEVKAALAKYLESRKAKQAQAQADLEQAQDSLRKVLTSRQEAIATLNGWL